MSKLTWVAFLHGITHVNKDERAKRLINLERPNKWELISLIVDTQVSRRLATELWDGMTWLEKQGLRLIKEKTPDITNENVSKASFCLHWSQPAHHSVRRKCCREKKSKSQKRN